MQTPEGPDHDRVEERAGDRLPDEQRGGDAERQAEAVLADSDDREARAGEVEHRSSSDATPPERS